MIVTDPHWLACFGTTDSSIEPVPKTTKIKPTRAQLAARMILDAARLRDAAHRERTLFDLIDEPQLPRTQQR